MIQDSRSVFEEDPLRFFRPEEQIIVLSAKSEIEPRENEKLSRLLKGNVDWDFLFRSALRSRTFPLLFSNLNPQFSEIAPEAIVAQFRKRAQIIHARNLILTNEILRVIDLLQANGIQPIPYKGPALAAGLYGNIALRQFVDLDLLIKYADVSKSREVLLADGYVPASEIGPMTPSQERAFVQFHYTYDFHSRELGNRLEMHWGIVPRYFGFYLDYDRLWTRAVPQLLNGTNILTLSPEDSLLILCVSGTKHLWNRLSRICDVAETIRKYPELNWDRLILEARSLGALRILFLALYLSKQLLNVPIPRDIWHEVEKDPAVSRLGTGLLHHLFPDAGTGAFFEEDAQFQPLFFRIRERKTDKFLYLARLVSTPGVAEWKLVTLPGSLYFIYYFLRPIRLAGKYARKSAEQYRSRFMNRKRI
jgi:hypothetical protein